METHWSRLGSYIRMQVRRLFIHNKCAAITPVILKVIPRCRLVDVDSLITSGLRKMPTTNELFGAAKRAKTMKKLTTIACLFVSICAVAGQNRKDMPVAPLPTIIVNAQKVFLANGGGSDLAYDEFYSEIKKWGKYQIVGSPDEADLIIELAYRVEHGGTRVWSSTNSYNGTTQVHSKEIVDPQLVLTIYDAKTKNSLWSTVDHPRAAFREKNREKETINSAERLVDELKARVNVAQ